MLPPEIVKLASLKVFSVQKNRIEELPLCLADMASLQMLKLDGNPIRFPPPEVFQVQGGSPSMEGVLKESEVTEVTVTSYLKKYLKQKQVNGRLDSDTGGDESSEGTETPRMPIKRVVSGRFPIKVNGSDVGDLRSPAFTRPPPIPTRSHYRGLSQQSNSSNSGRRPGVMPLTIGNANERVRSNSETLLQARSDQGSRDSRSRRMGIVSKKAQELATLDETEANNRFSHYRGLSHGSAMQGNGNIVNSKSPASPADMSRPVYIRRLSILPERRRESKFYDPVLEAAKGVLYSVFQIHPMIQMLMSLTSGDGSPKRSSLEIVVYNTNSHVQELEREIQMHDPNADGQEAGFRENESVHRACMTLVTAYAHICSLLAKDVDLFIENGDPRYIRTLLVQLYNSIMELRVTTSQLAPDESIRDDGYKATATKAMINETIKPHSRQSSVTPTANQPTLGQRAMTRNFVHNPSNLRVATDVPMSMSYNINGTGRTATITSATPRSGESFASNSSRGMTSEFTEEDQKFEKIFLSLQKSTDLIMRILPGFYSQFQVSLRNVTASRAPEHVLHSWRVLNAACSTSIQQTETLKSRLSNIKLKEPGIRTQDAFWTLCHNFIESWAETGRVLRQSLVVDNLALPPDTRSRLRPIQLSMKQTMELIKHSPWGYILTWNNSMSSSVTSPLAQVPMTPQSAALGPAVQATVPSTPQSASFANAFNGNVFERAGALINNGGLSMHSRGGTFSSISGSSMGSISSTVSSSYGDMTPSTVLSPNGGMGPFPLRLSSNQGGKVAF